MFQMRTLFTQALAWSLTCMAVLIVLTVNGWWQPWPALAPHVSTFVVIFLGILYEALPFLTAGALVAAGIHLFVRPEWLRSVMPKHPLLRTVSGGLLGIVFPVCECGSIPTARSLMHRGAPASFGMAFAMAAPVINPIVLMSTSVAFAGVWGWDFVAWRFGLTLIVATLVAQWLPMPATIVQDDHADHHDHTEDQLPLLQWLAHAAVDWLDMMRYLVVGAMIAASLQVVVPSEFFLSLATTPWLAIPAAMMLAAVMSICSTVDAFVGLSLANSLPPAAVMAFLVFGPIIDLKSIPMFAGLFGWATTLRMLALVVLITAGACAGLEWLGWL
jgi:uncharacterized membrane protein YraQ (UPF0718 family)